MKVTVKSHGIIHYTASCDDCAWQACIFTDQTPTEGSVRRAVRKHVSATGHTVTLESARSAQYMPKKGYAP